MNYNGEFNLSIPSPKAARLDSPINKNSTQPVYLSTNYKIPSRRWIIHWRCCLLSTEMVQNKFQGIHPNVTRLNDPNMLITVQPAFLQQWSIWFGQERINPNPQKGENWSKENRPDNNDCWCPVLPAQQTFEEGIEMDNNPEGKEELSEQRSPGFITIIDRIWNTGHNTN